MEWEMAIVSQKMVGLGPTIKVLLPYLIWNAGLFENAARYLGGWAGVGSDARLRTVLLYCINRDNSSISFNSRTLQGQMHCRDVKTIGTTRRGFVISVLNLSNMAWPPVKALS